MNQNSHSEALALLNRVIEAELKLTINHGTHISNHRFYVNRGDCFMALGGISLATADFHTAYNTAPYDWTVTTRLSMIHYNVATTLFNEGDFLGAEIELSAAIKKNPKIAQYYVSRGQAVYYQQKFDTACLDFLTALQLDPTPHSVFAI